MDDDKFHLERDDEHCIFHLTEIGGTKKMMQAITTREILAGVIQNILADKFYISENTKENALRVLRGLEDQIPEGGE